MGGGNEGWICNGRELCWTVWWLDGKVCVEGARRDIGDSRDVALHEVDVGVSGVLQDSSETTKRIY